MAWQYTPYTVPLLVAALFALVLSAYASRFRAVPGAWALIVLLAGIADWSLFYALEMAAPSLADKLFWANLEYLGIATIPAAWLVFALQYTGHRKWVSPTFVLLLCIGVVAEGTLSALS